MYRLNKIISFSFLFLPLILFSQDRPEYSIALIDPDILKHASSVIRSEETRYTIASPRAYMHQTTKVVTVLNDKSDESAVIVPYNKFSKAEVISIILFDASGRFIRRIKKSELLDEAAYDGISVFIDDRYIGVQSFGGKFPYTLEYKWVITHHETMYYPEWMPQEWEESVEKATFVLDAPADLIIHTKSVNGNFAHQKETIDGRTVQTWTLSNLKALKQEPSGPPEYEVFPMVLLAPSVFQVNDYTGSMSDWKSFGEFLYQLNKDREILTPDMGNLVRQMTNHCSSTRAKIDTLYRWMQKNMRYVSVQLGIGGWQSYDAAYVEKNRYGDCKALSTFMKGMLGEIGIESYQVVIKWDENESHFIGDFPIIDFNHMMLHIPSENMWLECTSNDLPAGVLHKYEENRKVLLLTPEGGKMVTTPLSTTSENEVYSLDTIFTDLKIISGRREYFGHTQESVRRHYFNSSREDQKKSFLENFPVTVKQLKTLKLTVQKNGLQSGLDYAVEVLQVGTASGDRYFIPVNLLHTPGYTCSDSKRMTAFYSHDDQTETSEVVISLPEGYTIEYLPTKTQLEYNGNKYLHEVTFENGYIHIHQKVTAKPLRLPPQQFSELCSFYQEVNKANAQVIILKKSKT